MTFPPKAFESGVVALTQRNPSSSFRSFGEAAKTVSTLTARTFFKSTIGMVAKRKHDTKAFKGGAEATGALKFDVVHMVSLKRYGPTI